MHRLLLRMSLHLQLLLVTALTLLPLAWMLYVSFLPSGAGLDSLQILAPTELTTQHYATLFTRLQLGRYLFNSALLATAVTLTSVLLNAMAGYAFAKLRFRGRDRLQSILTATLVIPGQIAMLPLFLLLKELGLVNSYMGIIVPGMASIFGIFLMRQYAIGIPDTLLDAARMDGASEHRIFWSIVLPVCRPILITMAVFTFMGTWNDFMWPLIILTDSDLYTLPVALANLLGEHVIDTELMMAGSVLTVLPVMAVFILLQRHYLDGIMTGSAKG